jgi:AraC family transcriptional activator of pobA
LVCLIELSLNKSRSSSSLFFVLTALKSSSSNLSSRYKSLAFAILFSILETLLNYTERFYQRQFITRKVTNHQILGRLEKLLSDYFNGDDLTTKGLPTVQYISNNLNISPTYLRSLLKALTGQTTQQHIHEKLIEKAKEKLSTTDLAVSEIAYELGFEHLQSFSKLFKIKTKLSPLEFRASFN